MKSVEFWGWFGLLLLDVVSGGLIKIGILSYLYSMLPHNKSSSRERL